jgi:hypothetical protein
MTETTTAAPALKPIIIELLNPTKIDFIICNTGEKSSRMVHSGKLALTRGTLFKIPLVDKTLNYKDSFVIKLQYPYTEMFRALDIVKGVVTLEPIIHGAVIENDMQIGFLF